MSLLRQLFPSYREFEAENEELSSQLPTRRTNQSDSLHMAKQLELANLESKQIRGSHSQAANIELVELQNTDSDHEMVVAEDDVDLDDNKHQDAQLPTNWQQKLSLFAKSLQTELKEFGVF